MHLSGKVTQTSGYHILFNLLLKITYVPIVTLYATTQQYH